MKILVTGASGMIGSYLIKALLDARYEVVGIDRKEGKDEREKIIVADLGDADVLKKIVEENKVDRVIHLAALAHIAGETDLSWKRYYHVNVECSKNVFEAAGDRPVLLISTVDVYGFVKGMVNGETELKPVTVYGKSKAMAEKECKKLKNYTIFRFSPVYTLDNKRDIQMRYYLQYPDWAYIIGKGSEYEVLSVEKAVQAMVDWVNTDPDGRVRVIKDERRLEMAAVIESEKIAGRAKYVLHFPLWIVACGYCVARITGKNKYTYLLHKAIHPLRSE